MKTMKISSFIVGTWRVLSILLVFGLSVFSYTLFSEDVGVHFDQFGKADKYLRKSDIFYIAMGLILVNNVFLLGLGRRLLTMPSHLLPIPNQAAWSANREALNEHLKNWFYCLVAAINTIAALGIFSLASVNNTTTQYTVNSFDWLIYLTCGLLIVILFALPIRLAIKPSVVSGQ
ncbi:MAG: hypothetical protein EAZ26_02890 [Runella slithyformis]|nr:MAG: hypothetical protein EAZ46_11280 [Runella sp.]TAG16741.1 MAG: hypothetical protein EAZ38_18395 [Cytophagales bacterium]TAG58852.1 MAG: hypothetical protein EAZ29_00375 [Runella slithyformis]TAG73785.1 MAG: hypothetical protein EAZ26_02890 [Runella slithyformis]TAG84024.1 MAG: hypothetical protein EAZ22_01185 [Cytophagales bacterium]